jgi:hypothetical protein
LLASTSAQAILLDDEEAELAAGEGLTFLH